MAALESAARAIVPCNGCFACCRADLLFLHPEMGDRAGDYLTIDAKNPLTGRTGRALAHQENGDCVYLDRSKGCTIHARAPAICREFDCRRFVRSMEKDLSRKEVRKAIRIGMFSKDVWRAGQTRAYTLDATA